MQPNAVDGQMGGWPARPKAGWKWNMEEEGKEGGKEGRRGKKGSERDGFSSNNEAVRCLRSARPDR